MFFHLRQFLSSFFLVFRDLSFAFFSLQVFDSFLSLLHTRTHTFSHAMNILAQTCIVYKQVSAF